jgi:hypothetical protein
VLSVTTEIVMGLDISDYEMAHITMIDDEVAALLPKWSSNPSMDKGNNDKTPNASHPMGLPTGPTPVTQLNNYYIVHDQRSMGATQEEDMHA